MRDYEFRGKLLNTNVWIYGNLRIHLVDGYLDQSEKRYYIEYNYMDKHGQVFRDSYEVDPSTVGQFTGLEDKNGKKIYEGDIIELIDRLVYITWHDYLCTYDFNFLKYKDDVCGNSVLKDVFKLISFNELRNYEVISNIHDFASYF